ncbi:MAG: hypothetical protein FWD06_07170 [Oscillospiraceae bacterium]|nr:hypothetical protein [Oscillospiraceae bacterium]
MAYLVECSLCKRQVSSETSSCPGCGHNVEAELSRKQRELDTQKKKQWLASPEGHASKRKYELAEVAREPKNLYGSGRCKICGGETTHGSYGWFCRNELYQNSCCASKCPLCGGWYGAPPESLKFMAGNYCEKCGYFKEGFRYTP